MSNKNDQFLEVNHLCFFVSTAGEKIELGIIIIIIIIISKIKVHTSCFQNEYHTWNKT